MKRSIRFFIMFLACCTGNVTIRTDSSSNAVTQLGNEIYSGGSSFLSGMAQSFGYVPSSYIYSFRVFNDTPGPIMVAMQDEANVMGATFAGNIHSGMNLSAFQDSSTTFLNQQLYLRVWLAAKFDDVSSYAKAATVGAYVLGVGAIFGGIAVTEEMRADAFFDKKVTSLIKENDPNVYFYHAFTSVDSSLTTTVQGEYLGVKDITTEFAGVFYNSIPEGSATEVSLDFIKNGTPYTVALEPNSFSLLQSDTPIIDSIRPQSGESRNFVFKQLGKVIAEIPISAIGIANVTADPNDSTKYVPAGSMTYTYQIYQKSSSSPAQVVMQGLNVGNFNQPVGRVRDINPLQCKVWYASAQQTEEAVKTNSDGSTATETDYSSIPFDITDSLWLSYKTKDQTVQMKLKPGAVIDIGLLRPQISEASASLYVAFIDSTDDTKSKAFLDRLHQGTIGTGATFTKITDPTNSENIQANVSPNPNGVIQDIGSGGTGLTGYVVLSDTMYPRGLGSGPYYYSIPSASLQVGTLANMLYFSDESYDESGSLKSDVLKDFATRLVGWIQTYHSNPTSVKTDVTSYIQSTGNKNLFDQTDSTKLSAYATTMIDLFLTGPLSISKPPLIIQAGINWYAFTMGAVPTGWPTI